jgi:hypothetical protein
VNFQVGYSRLSNANNVLRDALIATIVGLSSFLNHQVTAVDNANSVKGKTREKKGLNSLFYRRFIPFILKYKFRRFQNLLI